MLGRPSPSVAGVPVSDCNGNGVEDDVDISSGTNPDCNGNGIPDDCDISSQDSLDCNSNGVPDECDVAQSGIAKLTAADAATSDFFGLRVSISGDTGVIGASADDDGGLNSGSAYVFRAVGGVWQQIAKLTAADAAEGDSFGWSVSISGDTTLIGAYGDDDGGIESGAAYVFREVGGVWQQIAKLTAADAAADDLLGYTVSISGDTVVIGAPEDNDDGSISGSAYVFREVGGIWQQIAKLTAADAAADDLFGFRVSLSGNTAVIGAPADDDGGELSGSAYVFREVGGGWQQMAKLTADDTAANDFFGGSVSISGDTAVIGAHDDDDGGNNSGSAYVFREVGGVWQQVAKLTAADAAPDDLFGYSASISGDTAVIGSFQDDDSGAESGSTYVFREVGGFWQQIAKLTAADAAQTDFFGVSVSISGNTAVIGAYLDDDGGIGSGSAYVFQLGDDCNSNGIPDECELLDNDANTSGVPDECELGACCFGNGTCEIKFVEACADFVCNAFDHQPLTFTGCFADADGNGVVNAADRGAISANLGQTANALLCIYDLDGNGVVNAADRGVVSANINRCVALPDYQNGSGLNGGSPDTRFGAAEFHGPGTTCAQVSCP